MPRPRLTEKQKALRGTAQPCRKRNETASKDVISILPDAPDWVAVAPAAAAEWLRLGKILTAFGGLTQSSLTSFGHLCLLHSDMLAVRATGKSPTTQQQAAYLALAKAFRAVAISSPAVMPPVVPENPFAQFKTRIPT